MTGNRILKWLYHGLLWIYTGGYMVYLYIVGAAAWPNMTFMAWLNHISWESVYGMAWPVFLVMSALGWR